MQPNDPFNNQPQTPPPVVPTPQFQQPPAPVQPVKKKHRTLALWLLIGPSALFVITLVTTLMAPALFPDQPPAPGELFSEPHPGRTVINIFAFLSGAIVFLTWLPGIIIGSILLAKK